MKGTIKIKKAMSASLNAICAMREGKYFAAQMVLVDRAGSQIAKNTKAGKALWAAFIEDLKAAEVKSEDERSLNGREWHHIDKSSRGYVVWVKALIEAGWEITGKPNKELKF